MAKTPKKTRKRVTKKATVSVIKIEKITLKGGLRVAIHDADKDMIISPIRKPTK